MTRTPVILVSGIHATSVAAAVTSLQWDLPSAVVVRHTLDLDAQRLLRSVSDADGIIEETWMDLDHACASCALRADILPTLARLSRANRWGTIITHLPLTAEAFPVCRVLSMHRGFSRDLRIASVVTAVDGPSVVEDVFGDHLLRERRLGAYMDDARGVGECLSSLIEYGDCVVTSNDLPAKNRDLLEALARPGADIAIGFEQMDAATMIQGLHDHSASDMWVNPVRDAHEGTYEGDHTWTRGSRPGAPFTLTAC